LASLLDSLSIVEIRYLNTVIEQLKEDAEMAYFIPRLPADCDVHIQGVLDASLGTRIDAGSQGARAIGYGSAASDVFAPLDVVSRKVRRKGSSSFDVEFLTLVETADMAYVIGLLHEELQYGIRPSLVQRALLRLDGFSVANTKTKIKLDTDAKDSVERIYSLKTSLSVSKRRRIDIADMQEMLEFADITEFRHICGSTNPLDVGTKKVIRSKASYQRFLGMIYKGRYTPDLTEIHSGAHAAQQRGVRICSCYYCTMPPAYGNY
jgi:hypothetical protein